ncbi:MULTISPECIES: Sec-independent protein translocase protein TatB [Xenorhabdus]|uniref:Sec-independent protein translocase protein TatB n=1 Tax=Xenorhabdus TaxID=626 RepID=UPI001E4653A4|nr:Sec-independent protein translocase subunit TatB [Xenorhabdus sp. PB30.3]
MFDIGFSELLLVLVLGLIVLGPERLPVAVRTVAGWIRVLRSLATNVQNELTKELKLQELQDSLKKMEEKADLQSLSPELQASMDKLREAAESLKESYQLTPEEAKELEEDETHFHPPVSDKKSNSER